MTSPALAEACRLHACPAASTMLVPGCVIAVQLALSVHTGLGSASPFQPPPVQAHHPPAAFSWETTPPT